MHAAGLVVAIGLHALIIVHVTRKGAQFAGQIFRRRRQK
jgi:hypothetical protein